MDYLKETVYVEIGHRKEDWIPVGTIKEYVNLTELETAKLLYQRLNKNRTPSNWKNINECTEYAQEIRSGQLSKYITEGNNVGITFITTSKFENQWENLGLNDNDMIELERRLSEDPTVGKLIEGAGVFRKYRFELSNNHGKSSGARIIYIDLVKKSSKIYLSMCYSHSGKDPLTGKDKKGTINILKDEAKEYKKEATYMGESLEEMMIQVAAENKAYREGKIPRREIRRRYDDAGNLIREKAMVYYGESFDEALIREASENKGE